ncbi:hypothetical protein KL935_003265 [Ogataea polymorpha]|nr:hypothetical protein KL935_003265 [Ogataea polymorpha]
MVPSGNVDAQSVFDHLYGSKLKQCGHYLQRLLAEQGCGLDECWLGLEKIGQLLEIEQYGECTLSQDADRDETRVDARFGGQA